MIVDLCALRFAIHFALNNLILLTPPNVSEFMFSRLFRDFIELFGNPSQHTRQSEKAKAFFTIFET